MATYKGYQVTQEFGVSNPIYSRGYHAGIDLAFNYEPIPAFTDGVVVYQGYDKGFGNHIVLQNNDGARQTYAHLDSIYTFQGQSINGGTIIGKSGGVGANAGLSNGPHLHYQVEINGKPINPREYGVSDMLNPVDERYKQLGLELEKTRANLAIGGDPRNVVPVLDGLEQNKQAWLSSEPFKQKIVSTAAWNQTGDLNSLEVVKKDEYEALKASSGDVEANLLGKALIKLLSSFGYKK